MLLSDIYQEAGDMESRALRRSSWAKPYGAAKPGANPGARSAKRRGRLRRTLGHALMGLGRLIAAEPAQASTPARAGR